MKTIRSLAKSPLFTLAAVATLALGIGANTAVFSVLHSVVLAPLPYPDADRIVLLPAVNRARGIEDSTVTTTDLNEWRTQATSATAVGGLQFHYYNLTKLPTPLQVTGGRTSDDYFKVLAVKPLLGRGIEPRDCRVGSPPVAVLGHAVWANSFGADPNIIGRTVVADDKPTEIVGVMPAGFRDLYGITDLWVPLALDGPDAGAAGERTWLASARLKPGVPMAQARKEFETLAAAQARSRPEVNGGWTVRLTPAREALVEGVDTGLILLGGAGACLLLITCANVGGLVLARAQARRREVAIRTALGATRLDLVKQFLAEGLVLALAGGTLGAVIARLGVPLLVSVLPGWFPRTDEIAVNGTTLAVTAAVAMLTGILFGLLPVLGRRVPASPGRDLGARGSESGGAGRARAGLMVAEIALSVMLLAGAGLMVRSFLEIRAVPAGIRAVGLTGMVLNLSESRYPDRPARRVFYDAMLERVRAVSGVRDASLTRTTPFSWGSPTQFEIAGRPAAAGESNTALFDSIDPGFLQTMGTPLRAGRPLQPTDEANAPLVILISEAMAKKYFPDTNAIGQTLRLPQALNQPTAEIVGIVGDVKRGGLTAATPLQMYVSYKQIPPAFATLMVRSAGNDPAPLVKAVQKAIWAVNPDQPIGQVINMEALVSNSAGVPRLGLILFGTFAAVALVLAAVGLYGLIAYSVGARTREIGIRMALGAQSREIFRMILREGGVLVGIGLALGLVASLALARLMAGLVFGIAPTDPVSFALVVLVLGLVALAAAALPARRATRIDPNAALRAE